MSKPEASKDMAMEDTENTSEYSAGITLKDKQIIETSEYVKKYDTNIYYIYGLFSEPIIIIVLQHT